MTAVTREVAVGELRFTADVAGPDDGDVVLFLHGFPQTRRTWRHELELVAGLGFRGVAIDQRGYSPGARPTEVDGYRLDLLVADVIGVIGALGRRSVHLIGHDWGGHVAWWTAIEHPEAVTTLTVLSRPHPAAFRRALADDPEQSGRSGHHRTLLAEGAADDLLADGATRLRSLYDRSGVPADAANAYLEVLGERAALDSAIHWYRARGLGAPDGDPPGPVDRPTLYVWGTADATVGRTAAELTADHVTGPYRFVELDGVGHFATDEAPGAIDGPLAEHLRR